MTTTKTLWEKTCGPIMERMINGKCVKYKEGTPGLDDLSPDPKNGRLATAFIRARMEGRRVTQATLREIMSDRGDIESLAKSIQEVKAYDNPAWAMYNGLLVDGNRRFYAKLLNREKAAESGDHRGVFDNSKMRVIVFRPDVTYDDLMVAVYTIHQSGVSMEWDPACQAVQTAGIIASGKLTLEQVAKLKGSSAGAVEEQIRSFKTMERWYKYCLRNGNPTRRYTNKDTGVVTTKERDPDDYWTFIKRVVRHTASISDSLGVSKREAENYLFGLVREDRIEDCQMFDQLPKVLADRVARRILESEHPDYGRGCADAFKYLDLDIRQVRSESLDPIMQRIVVTTNVIRQNKSMLDDPRNGNNRRKAIVTLRRMIDGLLA